MSDYAKDIQEKSCLTCRHKGIQCRHPKDGRPHLSAGGCLKENYAWWEPRATVPLKFRRYPPVSLDIPTTTITGVDIYGQAFVNIQCPKCDMTFYRQPDNTLFHRPSLCEYSGKTFKAPVIPLEEIEEDKPKPCPFEHCCLVSVVSDEVKPTHDDPWAQCLPTYYVYCERCNAEGPHKSTRGAAVRAWNSIGIIERKSNERAKPERTPPHPTSNGGYKWFVRKMTPDEVSELRNDQHGEAGAV